MLSETPRDRALSYPTKALRHGPPSLQSVYQKSYVAFEVRALQWITLLINNLHLGLRIVLSGDSELRGQLARYSVPYRISLGLPTTMSMDEGARKHLARQPLSKNDKDILAELEKRTRKSKFGEAPRKQNEKHADDIEVFVDSERPQIWELLTGMDLIKKVLHLSSRMEQVADI